MKIFFKKVLTKIRLHKRKMLLAILFLGIFLFSSSVTFLFLTFSQIFVKKPKTDVEDQSAVTVDSQDAYNVLLLGYGGVGHDGGNLTDSIIVAHIDPINKQVNLISIPRDLWVEIPVRSDLSENHKINAAYTIGLDDNRFPLKEPQYKGDAGAAELTKVVVSKVICMPIKYFVAVSFDGFQEAINILGGVEVEVSVAFDDHFYQIKNNLN